MRLVKQLELVTEEAKAGNENEYYVFQANPEADLSQIEPFRPALQVIQKTKDVVLELAATYDAFPANGLSLIPRAGTTRRKKARNAPRKTRRSVDALRAASIAG